MPIKVNKVKIFRGTHDNIVKEYFQVVGYTVKFGKRSVRTVQEGLELDPLLATIKSMGMTYTKDEQDTHHEVWVPWLKLF